MDERQLPDRPPGHHPPHPPRRAVRPRRASLRRNEGEDRGVAEGEVKARSSQVTTGLRRKACHSARQSQPAPSTARPVNQTQVVARSLTVPPARPKVSSLAPATL